MSEPTLRDRLSQPIRSGWTSAHRAGAMLLLSALVVSSSAHAVLRVVATHADLAALAQEVGGERVQVTSIVEPTQDPHFVDARPHLMLELNKADLVVLVGLQLEVGWLPTLLSGARNPKILPGRPGYLDTSTLVERLQVPLGQVDRSMGDLHPGGNPHFTKAPLQALRVAHGLTRRLSQLDPKGARDYRRRLADFERRLRAAVVGWERSLEPYRGTPVVAYHESWVYFTQWLGLRAVGFVEPKPGIPPDPAHVAALLDTMKHERAPLVLQEEYYPSSTSRLLADKASAELLVLHGGAHLASGEGYLAYVGQQVKQILAVLKKRPSRNAAGVATEQGR